MKLKPIHPFPARMAPELILDQLSQLPVGATVLDPMVGSGTVMRASAELGLDCRGFDMDPLAVLMTKVWTTKLVPGLEAYARKIVEKARLISEPELPATIASSSETQAFANFWFEDAQQSQLSALSSVIESDDGIYRDALKLALSRLIITKENGASLARDTSHSRPHRVFFENKFCAFSNFAGAARRIEQRLESDLLKATAKIEIGDARSLPLEDASVDAVITSPPYLNAIDYMRGHRLSLIWLGFGLSELRRVRSDAIGAEAGTRGELISHTEAVPQWERMPARHQRMIDRYARDIHSLMAEMRRVTKPGGSVLVVVGDSTLSGFEVSNAEINVIAAKNAGLSLDARFDRELPSNTRYLPVGVEGSRLGKRMKTETVLRFAA